MKSVPWERVQGRVHTSVERTRRGMVPVGFTRPSWHRHGRPRRGHDPSQEDIVADGVACTAGARHLCLSLSPSIALHNLPNISHTTPSPPHSNSPSPTSPPSLLVEVATDPTHSHHHGGVLREEESAAHVHIPRRLHSALQWPDLLQQGRSSFPLASSLWVFGSAAMTSPIMFWRLFRVKWGVESFCVCSPFVGEWFWFLRFWR